MNENQELTQTQQEEQTKKEAHVIPESKRAVFVQKTSIVKPSTQSKYEHSRDSLQETIDIDYKNQRGSVHIEKLRVYSQNAVIENFNTFREEIGNMILNDKQQTNLDSNYCQFNISIKIVDGDEQDQQKERVCFGQKTNIIIE